MPLIIPANTISGGYEVANSLRFDDGSSDYLNKTFSTPTNNDICTLSFWIKKTGFSNHAIWSNGTTNENETNFVFQESGKFEFKEDVSNSATFQLITNRLFRDPSAWYHFVIAFDTTQATSSNRVKLYVNGSQETSFATETYPSQNTNIAINSNIAQYIGRRNRATDQYFDGYLAEMVFVDGQQLDPTSFGEFDADTGIWKPIDVSGLTFGTNGFYLDFENSGSLGADVSGNGNNFTVNNLTSIDQTTDTCTNNFATLNPLNYSSVSKTYAEGNTAITSSSSGSWNATLSNFAVSSGKWYTEYKITSVGSFSAIGVTPFPILSPVNPSATLNFTFLVGEDSGSFGWRNNGAMPQGGSISTYTTGDILMIAMDMDNLKVYFGKNGSWENSGVPTSGATGTGSIGNLTANEDYFFVISPRGGGTSVNFGNPPYSANGYSDANGYGNMSYSVPSGYNVLNTKNLAEYG